MQTGENDQNPSNRSRPRITNRIVFPISPGSNSLPEMIIQQISGGNSNNRIQLSIVPAGNNQMTNRIIIPLQHHNISQHSSAVRRFNEIVPHEGLFSQALEPKIVNQFHDIGVSHFVKKEYYLALKNFQKAYQKDQNPIFLANMAVCYRKIGAWGEALDMIHRVLEKDPRDFYFRFAGHLHFNLAKVNSSSKDMLQALDYFRDAYDLNKSCRNRHNYLLLRKVYFYRRLQKEKRQKNELLQYLNSGWDKPRKLQTGEYLQNKKVITTGVKCLRTVDVEDMDTKDLSLPDFCIDVISMDPYKIPVVTVSGNSFDKAHLAEHCRISGFFDPISRETFQNMSQVFLNKTLQKLIFSKYIRCPWKYDHDVNFAENEVAWKFSELS